LLVISPWAKQNYVDNTFVEQAPILKFIEGNWGPGTIGGGSADATAGSGGDVEIIRTVRIHELRGIELGYSGAVHTGAPAAFALAFEVPSRTWHWR
jgi:hypothetical protein